MGCFVYFVFSDHVRKGDIFWYDKLVLVEDAGRTGGFSDTKLPGLLIKIEDLAGGRDQCSQT